MLSVATHLLHYLVVKNNVKKNNSKKFSNFTKFEIGNVNINKKSTLVRLTKRKVWENTTGWKNGLKQI
jgi:hypothetical protein